MFLQCREIMRSNLNLLLKTVKNIWKVVFAHGADILLNFWKHYFCREICWYPGLCQSAKIIRATFFPKMIVNNCQSERHCCNNFSKISHFHIGCCWSFISYYFASIFQLGNDFLALRACKMGRRGYNSPSALNEIFS